MLGAFICILSHHKNSEECVLYGLVKHQLLFDELEKLFNPKEFFKMFSTFFVVNYGLFCLYWGKLVFYFYSFLW